MEGAREAVPKLATHRCGKQCLRKNHPAFLSLQSRRPQRQQYLSPCRLKHVSPGTVDQRSCRTMRGQSSVLQHTALAETQPLCKITEKKGAGKKREKKNIKKK